MNAGLLDFFIIEATEQVEGLDDLMARAGTDAPDGEAMARHARILRGSATMARQAGIAEVGAGLEQLARAVRAGTLPWDARVRAAVIAAVDDLRILLRGVRRWGDVEAARAARRADALAQLIPLPPHLPAPAVTDPDRFVAAEADALAAGLERYAANPVLGGPLTDTLRRVRALRGLAALRELPPLAEVVEATDDALKLVEIGRRRADEPAALCLAAAAVLREAAGALASGARPDPTAPTAVAFAAAGAAFNAVTDDGDAVVPIADLFGKAGSTVFTAPHPPTTPADRFRTEIVSHAEHLRRLVHDARQATDPVAVDRAGRALRIGVRTAIRHAESFGQGGVVRVLAAAMEAAAGREPQALDALERAARRLAAGATDLEAALTPIVTSAVPPLPPVIGPRPAAPGAPTGETLGAMLGASLASLDGLAAAPLAEPATVEPAVVPIEDLLYRGRDALDRARALGRTLEDGAAPDADTLAELLDLLDLAASE